MNKNIFSFGVSQSHQVLKPVLILCVLIIFGSTLFAQQLKITGTIIDLNSGDPVIAAHIIKPDSTGTFSHGEGEFELLIYGLPVTLKIRHLSYGEMEVNLFDPIPDPLIIRVKKKVSQIGEVQISGQRLRILTEKEDYNLHDFTFDNDHLWMTGFLNNQANKGRLWLANWFGDTISSLPIRGFQELYRDVFGNAHLVFRDTVYQLFADENDMIHLLHPYPKDIFMTTMKRIRAGFNNRLVYDELSEYGYTVMIFYHEENDPQRKFLTRIEDGLARRDYRLFLKVGGTAPINLNVLSPMFTWKDSLYILNVVKDSLLCFNSEGKFARGIPFHYHKVKFMFEWEYFKFDFVPDPMGSRVFIIDGRDSRWFVHCVNPLTGDVDPPLALPDFPGMSRITPFGDAIYFLYPEKKYPFYTRLYRFQL